jgi:hypothetical protein
MGNFLNLDEAQVAQSVRSSFFKQQAITEKNHSGADRNHSTK